MERRIDQIDIYTLAGCVEAINRRAFWVCRATPASRAMAYKVPDSLINAHQVAGFVGNGEGDDLCEPITEWMCGRFDPSEIPAGITE